MAALDRYAVYQSPTEAVERLRATKAMVYEATVVPSLPGRLRGSSGLSRSRLVWTQLPCTGQERSDKSEPTTAEAAEAAELARKDLPTSRIR